MRVLTRAVGAPEAFTAPFLERLPTYSAAVLATSKVVEAASPAPRLVVGARVVLSRCGPCADSSRGLRGRVLGLVGTVREVKAGKVKVRRVGAAAAVEDWYYASELMLESEACAELDALNAASPLSSPVVTPPSSSGGASPLAKLSPASGEAGAAQEPTPGFAAEKVASPPPPPVLTRELSAAYADERTFVEVMGLPDLLRR